MPKSEQCSVLVGQGPYQIPPMTSASQPGNHPALPNAPFARPYSFYIRHPPANAYVHPTGGQTFPAGSHPHPPAPLPRGSSPQGFALSVRLDQIGRPMWNPTPQTTARMQAHLPVSPPPPLPHADG